MPARGPKPKPEKIKKLGGRAHRKKESVIDFPSPPEMKLLPHEIRMELEEIWKYLVELGAAHPVDRGAFSRYITLRRIQDEAERDIDERGVIIRKGSARERFNPSFRVLQSTLTELLKIEEQFGMTPSARRRLPARQKKKENGYAAQREAARRENRTA